MLARNNTKEQQGEAKMADPAVHHEKKHGTETALGNAPPSIDPDFSKYLQETEICNHGHPMVQEVLHAVTDGCVEDKDKAIRIFLLCEGYHSVCTPRQRIRVHGIRNDQDRIR
jgi:hypothetical protein